MIPNILGFTYVYWPHQLYGTYLLIVEHFCASVPSHLWFRCEIARYDRQTDIQTAVCAADRVHTSWQKLLACIFAESISICLQSSNFNWLSSRQYRSCSNRVTILMQSPSFHYWKLITNLHWVSNEIFRKKMYWPLPGLMFSRTCFTIQLMHYLHFKTHSL
jgi:hypothetical protein